MLLVENRPQCHQLSIGNIRPLHRPLNLRKTDLGRRCCNFHGRGSALQRLAALFNPGRTAPKQTSAAARDPERNGPALHPLVP